MSGVVFTLGNAVIGLAAGVAVALLAAVTGGLRASRTSPLAAMRDAAIDGSGASRGRAPAKPGPAGRGLDVLTDRETQVLVLIGEGLTNQEIAQRLVVSPLTAKTHVSRVLAKLGARDRVQLVVLAYESGLVRPGWTAC